ncbi:MAG: hypothetical protein AVDCRST_MAG68-3012, partial [uncultured Gemmatimonadetes bacterium]
DEDSGRGRRSADGPVAAHRPARPGVERAGGRRRHAGGDVRHEPLPRRHPAGHQHARRHRRRRPQAPQAVGEDVADPRRGAERHHRPGDPGHRARHGRRGVPPQARGPGRGHPAAPRASRL